LAALYEFMQEAQVDIAALTECNTAWNKLDYSELPSQQTKYWWENAHWSISHNRQDPDSAPYQPGGTGIVVVNQLSHRAQRPGDDKAGLGRWCWARLRGKDNKHLRVVSVYRPCPSNGPLSTYQQQVRYWSAQNNDCCPRDKLLADLKEAIAMWQAEGDQVLILADMNEDVNAPMIRQFCDELHLVEAISTLHGPAQKPTHQRGRRAIDGIYMSRSLLHGARGGFLQFGDVMGSDHRAVWVDISADIVGMKHQDPITSPARRRLKCQDPRIIQKYNQELLKVVMAEGWEQRMSTLFEAAANNKWSAGLLTEYNALDQEFTKAKLAAELGCRKFKAGRQPWTPALTQAIQRILYWKGVAKRAQGGQISTTVLKRRAIKGQLQFSCEHWALPRNYIQQRISSAYDDYLLIKKQKHRRETWLTQLVEAMATAKNIPKLRLWKQIKLTETARNQASQVKRATGQTQVHSGLSQVSTPDTNNPNSRIMVYDKDNIEKACLTEAHHRFTQAADTPILRLSRHTGLDNLGTGSPAFTQILDGTFDMSAIQDPYTVQLLTHLGRPPGIKEIELRTKAEYRAGWKKAKEQTSSSPSGVHFGHYIASIEEMVLEKINRLMATIPLLTGISPARWRRTLNVMLEKMAGNCSVEKLRIIMLFEADFNNNNKWLGRAIMANAERQQLLAPEQYGSRKGKAAGVQCLNKRLFYDYIRAMHIPAALCSNDAKSCYDRIVLIIAALCLCCLGAPIKATESMISTLAQL